MKIPLLMSPVREEGLSGREFLKREEGTMTEVQSQAIAAIEAQQEGRKRDAAWMIGEQLKDICRREPHSAELLLEDLQNPKMALVEAEKKIAERARQNRQGHCGCVTPWEAEEILREFYGLGGAAQELPAEEADQRPQSGGKILDLADFM